MIVHLCCCCRFDIRLRGYLSKHKANVATASNVVDFKRTRLFKYVPLQCVTIIMGPFGDDLRFLTSSDGFHTSSNIHIVTFEEVEHHGYVHIGFVAFCFSIRNI